MIRYLLLTGFILFSLSGFAQFVPNSSQAFQFMSFYNPAFSGIDAHHDIRLGYRYQWAGLEGAPKSVNLSYNMRIRQPLDLNTNALRTSNPNALIIPNKKLTIHGLGVNIFQMSFGTTKTSGAGVNYSLHYALTKKLRLAAGVGAVIENTRNDLSQIKVGDEKDRHDDYFDYLKSKGDARTDVSTRAGLLLYTDNFYLGFSYLPLFKKSIQAPLGSSGSNGFYKASVQAGYAFPAGPNFIIRPSILALLYTSGGVAIDYNVKAFLGDKIWFGLSYRDIQAGSILLGFNINNTFNVAYAYEMSLGKFKAVNNGSHELVLGVKLNNFKRQGNYTW